jgi:hypothetical protein
MAKEEERSVVAGLSAKYPIFAVATIQRWVANEFGKYTSAKIQTYVPVLVQRTVDATLRDLASTDGTTGRITTTDRDTITDRNALTNPIATSERVTTGAR